MSTIISVHVPKTAGKSFLAFLIDAVGDAHVYKDWPDGPEIEGGADPSRGRDIVRQKLNRIYVKLPKTRCVHGHFRASKYADIDGPMVAWVRDPVERIVSHFEYFRREPDPANLHAKAIQNGLSLLDFASHPGLKDLQSKYLDVPLERFAFVGRTESFASDLPRAAEALGLSVDQVPAANTNPHRVGDRYGLDEVVRRRIRAMHEGDAELYERVAERFG